MVHAVNRQSVGHGTSLNHSRVFGINRLVFQIEMSFTFLKTQLKS